MRAIDADALIADLEYDVERDAKALDSIDSVGRDWETIWFDKNCKQNAIDLLQHAPTIEPERKKGKWIYLDKDKRFFHPHIVKCSVCDNTLDMYGVNAGRGDANFCPNCGADMRTPVETARDIVHKAIDNSVWSDIVDTAEMHKVVDDWCAENGGDVNADVES